MRLSRVSLLVLGGRPAGPGRAAQAVDPAPLEAIDLLNAVEGGGGSVCGADSSTDAGMLVAGLGGGRESRLQPDAPRGMMRRGPGPPVGGALKKKKRGAGLHPAGAVPYEDRWAAAAASAPLSPPPLSSAAEPYVSE